MVEPFFYDLPDDRIAQRPVHPPEAAKLLVHTDRNVPFIDTTYNALPDLLKAGDVMVFNNTKVVPARLFGRLKGSDVELLLLKRKADGLWYCLGKPLKKFTSGTTIELADGVTATIVERTGDKEVLVRFTVNDRATSASFIDTGDVDSAIFKIGNMPIPPYIRGGKSDDQDKIDYQTIFAKQDGSVAAPTASLHFSKELKEKIVEKGILLEEITLHVGAASFLPLWDEGDVAPTRTPGLESYVADPDLLARLHANKEKGGTIIPVGTTVVRALESMASLPLSQLQDRASTETTLFITPGFEFKICDRLITNFHQPRTTHLLLVESFIGRERLAAIYNHALENHYRFLSYGDGMLL